MIGVFFAISGDIYTMYPSFDWYDPQKSSFLKTFNYTFFHVFETSVLGFCYILHR